MEGNNKEITLAQLAEKIDALKTKMGDGFASVRQEFKGEIDNVHRKMDKGFEFLAQEISEARDESNDKFNTLKVEITETRNELNSRMDNVQSRMTTLELGMFTEDEKNEALSNLRHYNKWLKYDAQGEKRITLTREEYNAMTEALHLPNRFSGLGSA